MKKIPDDNIKINIIKETPAYLCGPNGYIGRISDLLQMTDIRTQICEKKLSGYYIIFKKEKFRLKPNGLFEFWPDGLFDTHTKQLAKILKLRLK